MSHEDNQKVLYGRGLLLQSYILSGYETLTCT